MDVLEVDLIDYPLYVCSVKTVRVATVISFVLFMSTFELYRNDNCLSAVMA